MEILDFSGEPTFGDGMVVLAILQVQIPLEKRQSLILVLSCICQCEQSRIEHRLVLPELKLD